MHNKKLNYRPDIDGLRAVAVLLVVLNHVGFSVFSGGFIGVDVFFVISGYLITGIILGQAEKGSFSFYDFYLRRARRILPALYVVVLAVMIAGYYLYIPSDYSEVSKSALSAIGFASNVFFWKNSGGYFSSSAEEMPLLHIWSLSVEEQFYFVWPLALVLIVKLKSATARAALVAFIMAVSFIYAEVGVRESWISTYFLLPSRAGELLVGALLAFWVAKREPVSGQSITANIAALTGLALVLLPALSLTKTSLFPGINALIPCLGAALIIGSRTFGQTVVSYILSLRPLVFVGVISYSLYLWHWPLVSFLRYSRVEITTEIAIGLVAASIALGYLSWRLVEQTFRHRPKQNPRLTSSVTILAALLVIATPVAVYLSEGIPSRFPYAMLTADQLAAEKARYWNGVKTTETVFDISADRTKAAIVGNSHAYDFSYALTENGFNGDIKLIETSFYCFNFSHDAVWPEKKDFCADDLKKVLNSPELKTADIIYLHDNWGGKDFDGLGKMISSIKEVSHAPIYVIGPKMTYTETVLNISKEAQQQRHITTPSINEFSKKYEYKRAIDYDQELIAYFLENKDSRVKYISFLNTQCGSSLECEIISKDGEYLYFDSSHFTLTGSRTFGKKLKEQHSELFE